MDSVHLRPQLAGRAAGPNAGCGRPCQGLCRLYCLLFISSKLSRCARRALRCSPRSSCRAGSRGLGSHWVAYACMGVASPCVCCKPVAEGGAAGADLRMLRGARNRSIIWVRGPGKNSSALAQPGLPDARPRGEPFPLTHDTRCLAGGGLGGPAWSLVWGGACRTRCRRWRGALGVAGPLVSISEGRCAVGEGPSWTRGAL
jgi:hypothetical protein